MINNEGKYTNQMGLVYKKWVSIHEEMEKRFKTESEISTLATNLQTKLNTIITTIRGTNSNNNDQSLLPNIITTVRETLYPDDKKGQNNYNLFAEFLPHATGVEGFDNPFEVEFAAILSTAINEINKNTNSNISTTPSSFVAAQSSYKTKKPTYKNLETLLKKEIEAVDKAIIKKLITTSKIYNMQKEGNISGGKSDIFIEWKSEWNKYFEKTISTEIPDYVMNFMKTLYDINNKGIPLSFSLKQYKKPEISFGDSKFYTSLYLPILKLRVNGLNNQMRIDKFIFNTLTYAGKIEKQKAIMGHIYHVRSIYEITGFGQIKNTNNQSVLSSQAYFLCILTKDSENPAKVIYMNDIINDILNTENKKIAIKTTKSFNKDTYTIPPQNNNK